MTFIGMFLSIPALADQASAMEQLQTGYEHCKSAHVLRRKDLDAAQAEYQQFLDNKNKALSEYPSINTDEDPEVVRILGYCGTVGSDLSRSQALPVFQEGEKLCGEAAELMQQNLLSDAELKFDQYQIRKSHALSLSHDILDVYSVASVARRCERLGEQLQQAKAKREKIRQELENLAGRLQNYLSQCESANTDDISQLVELRQNLEQAEPDFQRWGQQEDVSQLSLWNEITALNTSLVSCRGGLGEALQQQLADQRQVKITQIAEVMALADENMLWLQAHQAEESEEQRVARLARNLDKFELIDRVSPRFPQRALNQGRSGFVVVQYQVLPSGEVADPVILDSEPGTLFNEAALDAIRQWRYQPVAGEDAPELAIGTTRFSFDLN